MSEHYIATDDVATIGELRELFSVDEDDDEEPLAGIIPVCAGEWRRESNHLWRFWKNPELDGSA